MKIELRIPLYMMAVGALVVFAVSSVPPLTNDRRGNSGDTVSDAQYRATVSLEHAFCKAQGGEVDCHCFAQKSSSILSHDAPRVPGAVYADKHELARGQAIERC